MFKERCPSVSPPRDCSFDQTITQVALECWDKELAEGYGIRHLVPEGKNGSSFYIGLALNSKGLIIKASLLRKKPINQNLEHWLADREQKEMEEKAKKIFGLTG